MSTSSEPPIESTPPVLRLRSVPANQGAVWVRDAFRVFFRWPLAFALMAAVGAGATELLFFLPFGIVLVLGLIPLTSLGFMIATRRALEGQFPWPSVYLEPLRRGRARWMAQLQLGLLYAVSAGLILLMYRSIDGAAMAALQKAMVAGDMSPEKLQPLLMDSSLWTANLLMVTLSSLLSVLFWHAPALAHWGHQSAAKALFSSTLACWRNRGALTIYGLAWVGVLFLFVLTAQVVFSLLRAPQLVNLVPSAAQLLFGTLILVSSYFSFADSFERVPTSPAEITP